MTGVARFTELLYGVVGYSTASWPYAGLWSVLGYSVLLSSLGAQWFDPPYPAGQRPSLSSAHPQDVQS